MKTVIISLISAGCGAFLFASCCQPQDSEARTRSGDNVSEVKTSRLTEDFLYGKQQLQMLAVELGYPQGRVKDMSLGELVSEIRSRLRSNERKVSSDNSLNTEEWDTVRVCLAGADDIIEKIEMNEKRLKALRGKRILIFPEDASDGTRR